MHINEFAFYIRRRTMEQMNCDIIRDLIPSYVEEVCSESTKQD